MQTMSRNKGGDFSTLLPEECPLVIPLILGSSVNTEYCILTPVAALGTLVDL